MKKKNVNVFHSINNLKIKSVLMLTIHWIIHNIYTEYTNVAILYSSSET